MVIPFRSVCFLLALLVAAGVVAQESTSQIEEVVVTARKRSETLLDTPLAITAVSEAQMERSGFKDILDVAQAVPGLYIQPTTSFNARVGTTPRIRGVYLATADRLHQTVTVFVDGVPVPDGFSAIGVNGLERVEVIKGPQSAVFGRNTFAGAINLISKDPGNELAFDASLLGTTRDQYEVVAGIEGPAVNDVLNWRVDGRFRDVKGHYDNTAVPGQTLGDESNWSVGGTLLFTPTPDLRIKLRGFYTEVDDGPRATTAGYGIAQHNFGGFPIQNGVADTSAPFDGPSNRVTETESTYRGPIHAPSSIGINTGRDTVARLQASYLANPRAATAARLKYSVANMDEFGLRRDAYFLSANGVYSFSDNTTLSILGGYNKEAYAYWDDFDMTSDNSFIAFVAAELEDYSAEIRLESASFGGKLRWVIGASQTDTDIAEILDAYADEMLGVWLSTAFPETPSRRGSRTAGVFASLDYQLSEKLNVTIEGRYQDDEFWDDKANVGAITPISPASITSLLPRLTLQYRPIANASAYFTVSKGNLAGGFNSGVARLTEIQLAELRAVRPEADVKYGEETLTNYELGWKQAFNRASLNAALFYMKRSDEIVQYNQFVSEPPGTIPAQRVVTFNTNGAETDIYGIELESTWQVNPYLRIDGSFSYIDSTIAAFPRGASTGDFGDIFGPQASVEGQVAPRFPPIMASLGARYERPVVLASFDNWYVQGDVFYNNGYWTNNANVVKAPEVFDSNLRMGLKGERFGVEFFVTNLFDEDAPLIVGDFADVSFDVRTMPGGSYDFTREAVSMSLRPKREFGIRASFSF